jgi:hypothetical protein
MWHFVWLDRRSDDRVWETTWRNNDDVFAGIHQPLRNRPAGCYRRSADHPALAGAIVGALISLPDAFGLNSYVGVLGTGILFGALTGWAASMWGS